MHRASCRQALLSVLTAAAAFLIQGCATPAMKGTPYYTTEPDPDPQAAKERIPLWPLVYYRAPTLSVLWPCFEKSDEYMALRPLASVYGLNQPKRIYSLLWPLGQFDRMERANRFFPLFWGDRYAVAFPLYWHFGHPLGKGGGTDGLIPLWWLSTRPQGYSFDLMWPFVNVARRPGHRGWRVWPLLGSYSGGTNDFYRFAAWPLAHHWANAKFRTTGHAVLPLYLSRTNPFERLFVSIPYSRYRGPFSRRWDLLMPVFYSQRDADRKTFVTLLGGRRRNGDDLGWIVPPLLSGGTVSKNGHSAWMLGPMAHFGRAPGRMSRHVFPLFYAASDASGHRFLSVPWSSGSSAQGSRWQLMPPLMFRSSIRDSSRLLTPLYSAGASQGGTNYWQTVIPLWYRSRQQNEKTIATLLGGWQTSADGHTWLIWPLLSGGRWNSSGRDLWIAAPIFRARRDSAGLSSHLLPLYWWSARDRALLSPFLATWANPSTQRKTTVAPPALTLYSSQPGRKDLWTVAGAAHFSWGPRAGSSHILPLFYRDKSGGTFVSLPYARWTADGVTNNLFPPLLSMYSRTATTRRFNGLLGLVSEEWGDGRHEGFLFPLYYHDGWKTVLTPFVGWHRNPEDGFCYPLTPLIGIRTGRCRGGWVFPFWSRRHDPGNKETSGAFLWGSYRSDGRRTESQLLPVFNYRNEGAAPAVIPPHSVGTTYGKRFWCLPAIWYRNTVSVMPSQDSRGQSTSEPACATAFDHGFFPLWSHSRETSAGGGDERHGSVLLCLYDYDRSRQPRPGAAPTADEHVRRRLLWKMYSYERRNDDVSVDIFPAITYDRTQAGFRRWSLLWRLFRYERGPEGKKLDLLFIPLLRSGPESR